MARNTTVPASEMSRFAPLTENEMKRTPMAPATRSRLPVWHGQRRHWSVTIAWESGSPSSPICASAARRCAPCTRRWTPSTCGKPCVKRISAAGLASGVRLSVRYALRASLAIPQELSVCDLLTRSTVGHQYAGAISEVPYMPLRGIGQTSASALPKHGESTGRRISPSS